MNICAVRTAQEYDRRTNGWGWIRTPLPHEPESEERYFMRRFDPVHAGIGAYSHVEFTVCKYCGSVYAVSQPTAASTTEQEGEG